MEHITFVEDQLPYYLPIASACNQRCVFCDPNTGVGEGGTATDELLERLRSLRNDKMITTVTFTGGEPTINPALPQLIRGAKGFGFKTIGIETNGMMLSYPRYADTLTESGLTHVRVTMASHKPAVSDELTQTPCGAALTGAGIAHAVNRGLHVTVQIPLLAATIAELAEHVGFVCETYPGVRRIELLLIGNEPCGHGDIPIPTLETELNRAFGVAQRFKMKLTFQACHGPAPCLFENPGAVVSMFNIPSADESEKPDYMRVAACDDCMIACVCPGIHPRYIDSAPRDVSGKITPDFARRVLRPGPGRGRMPIEDQRRQGEANFCTFSFAVDAGGNKIIREAMLRINYNCNQRCLFCWLEPGYDNLPHEAVIAKISEFSGINLKTVSITGGEPTLNPNLADYIKKIHEAGAGEICLQTNAMLLNDPARVRALMDAGLNSAFVSLHSHLAEISDLLTGMEGGFNKTVEGVKNLIVSGAIVFLSHVINSFNYKTLPEFIGYVTANFKKVPIIFSYAAPIYGAMMHRGLIPALTEIKGPLAVALEKCYELKVPFAGLSGMCGIPPCILDGNLRYYPDINRVAEPEGGEDMIKIADCRQCSLDNYCYGLRKNYADIYGTGELHAVHVDEVRPVVLDYVKPEDFFNQMIS
jgi:molybdenum cofactor biosynthesis enzyme MoaA